MTAPGKIATLAVLSLFGACRPTETAAPVEVNEGSAAAAPAPVGDEGLVPMVDGVFGLPAPTSVVLEEARESLRHYRISAPFEDIVDFFAREMPDGVLTRYERGAKFEAADGRSVYIYRELGESDYLLTYFDGTQPAGGGDSTTASGGAPERALLDQGFGDPADTGGSAPSNPAGAGPTAGPESDPWAVEPALPGQNEPPSLGFRVINPRVHPRLRASQPIDQRPIDFVRGVHEPRRNPDAQF